MGLLQCDVTVTQEHLRKRLEAEQAEKEQRQKDKAEAHQYVSLKVCQKECQRSGPSNLKGPKPSTMALSSPQLAGLDGLQVSSTVSDGSNADVTHAGVAHAMGMLET